MTLADRLIDLNRWYEGLPDTRRVFVYPAVLVAAGLVNTRLTGAPIGWVSLSALVALFVVRRSYVSGWLAAQAPAGGPVPDTRHRTLSEPVAPAAVAKPEPVRPAPAVVAKADPVIVAERRADRAGGPSFPAGRCPAHQPRGAGAGRSGATAGRTGRGSDRDAAFAAACSRQSGKKRQTFLRFRRSEARREVRQAQARRQARPLTRTYCPRKQVADARDL